MTSIRTRRRADWWVLIVAACFAIAVAAFINAARTDATTGNAGPVAVTVTSGDGLTLAIHAEAPAGTEIFEIRAHLCQPGAGINDTYAFGFQDGFCPNAPIGDGDFDQHVELPRGTSSADLNGFKVGTGTVDWTDELGAAHSLTCGPGSPCDVVVQLQITNTTTFFTAPVCYADCPAPAPGGSPPLLIGAAAAAPPPTNAPSPPATDGAPAAGSTVTTAAPSAGVAAAGSGSASGSARPERDVETASAAAVASTASTSRTVQVLAGEAAGLIGGVLIVLIVVRGRRKLALREGLA